MAVLIRNFLQPATLQILPDIAFICPKKTPLGNLCLFSSTEKKMLKKKKKLDKKKIEVNDTIASNCQNKKCAIIWLALATYLMF